jgi:hypothetical protein
VIRQEGYWCSADPAGTGAAFVPARLRTLLIVFLLFFTPGFALFFSLLPAFRPRLRSWLFCASRLDPPLFLGRPGLLLGALDAPWRLNLARSFCLAWRLHVAGRLYGRSGRWCLD